MRNFLEFLQKRSEDSQIDRELINDPEYKKTGFELEELTKELAKELSNKDKARGFEDAYAKAFSMSQKAFGNIMYFQGIRDGYELNRILKSTKPEWNERSKEQWNIYAKKYNCLSDKIKEAGINIELLADAVEALENFYKEAMA